MCEKNKKIINNATLISIISLDVVTKSWFKHVVKYLIKQQDADLARYLHFLRHLTDANYQL